MPKYWGKQIFAHGSFPEVGQKQKTEKEERRRPKVGNNNGQLCNATSGCARKATWANWSMIDQSTNLSLVNRKFYF